MVHATPRTLTNRFIPAYPRWEHCGTNKEVPCYISEKIGSFLSTLERNKVNRSERKSTSRETIGKKGRRCLRTFIFGASFTFTVTFTILVRSRSYVPAKEREDRRRVFIGSRAVAWFKHGSLDRVAATEKPNATELPSINLPRTLPPFLLGKLGWKNRVSLGTDPLAAVASSRSILLSRLLLVTSITSFRYSPL